MFAVYGTAVFCGGLLLFFFMLHLHRRPGVAHWLEFRAVGEITLYICMMMSLYGIAMIGQYSVKPDPSFGILKWFGILASLVVTVLAIRKLYLPAPEPKQAPAPVEGIDGQMRGKPAARKRAA